MVARLAVEVGQGMGDLAVPPFWDTVCGLVARSWRLEACLAISAVYRLDGLWWMARDFDRSAARGLELIWQGMTLKELSDHVDVSRDAAELLTEADRLVPDDVRDAPFCEIVLETLR
ncbi:hypothetical protein [Streptodolium elevatio]|uniref:Uncharacterized protein n=1 Tax=Streptodolium elevatio TaxID=3157996 RepID=A0ABV3DNM0_9ACTN